MPKLKFNPTNLFSVKLRTRILLKNKDVVAMLKTAHLYGELHQSYTNVGQDITANDYTFPKLLTELEN